MHHCLPQYLEEGFNTRCLTENMVPRNLESYILLPSRRHNGCEYPDLLVSPRRTLREYTWHQAHLYLEEKNCRLLTIRQFIDFLQLLRSDNVFDGKGNKLPVDAVRKIYKNTVNITTDEDELNQFFTECRLKDITDLSGKEVTKEKISEIAMQVLTNPRKYDMLGSTEWLDARITYRQKNIKFESDNRVVKKTSETGQIFFAVTDSISENFQCPIKHRDKGIFFKLGDCNHQGIPQRKRWIGKKNCLKFYPPKNRAQDDRQHIAKSELGKNAYAEFSNRYPARGIHFRRWSYPDLEIRSSVRAVRLKDP